MSRIKEDTLSEVLNAVSEKKGTAYFLAAGSGTYQIAGTCDTLVTSVRG